MLFYAAVSLCAAFALPATAAERKAPVTELATEKLEQRVAELEKMMQKQGLLDMLQQLQELKTEINSLRGQLETKTNELELLQEQQRNLNAGIDARLKKLEEQAAQPAAPAETAPTPLAPSSGKSAAPATAKPVPEKKPVTPEDAEKTKPAPAETAATSPDTPVIKAETKPDPEKKTAAPEEDGITKPAPAIKKPGDAMTLEKILPDNPTQEAEPQGKAPAPDDLSPEQPSAGAGDPLEAQAEYQQAFKLLKQSQYDKAIAAFQALLNRYPQGQYSDSAQYWIGEAYYVTRRYNEAINEYMKLLTNYPQSKKAPNCLLKIGYSYFELKHDSEARKVLQYLIKRYPGTSAAQDAEKRLQQ